MDLGRVLSENWPYKVAAIVLSVLLWLSVSAEAERAEQAVPTRLEVLVNDSAWSLREVRPAEILTTFRGGRGDVFASLFEQPTIRKVVDEVTEPLMQVPLSPSEVIYNPSLGVEPTGVDPTSVTIVLEERLRKRVPVQGRTDATARPGAVVMGMQVAPDSVWLQGPASFVNSIAEVTTELLAVGPVSDRVTRQLTIVLPPDMTGLEVTPATVLGTVDVDSIITRRFRRTVTATGPLAEHVSLDPPTVTVSVTGPAATVDGLDAADLVVAVEVTASPSETASRPVRVELPQDIGVGVTVDLDPGRVTVRLGPAAAPDPSTR